MTTGMSVSLPWQSPGAVANPSPSPLHYLYKTSPRDFAASSWYSSRSLRASFGTLVSLPVTWPSSRSPPHHLFITSMSPSIYPPSRPSWTFTQHCPTLMALAILFQSSTGDNHLNYHKRPCEAVFGLLGCPNKPSSLCHFKRI